ncbi:MAG: FkbM family methyltransferase [Rhodothermaceae bacterium]|nr:FkbM family methyltransferase [Rhodothermaceae bacterium]MYC04956.1 FkbM family methyltransferase [Rhodothermaceae bacterium]MYI18014.1 FkbM family methyltransferase [Rhodothermaceae bacterium]
MRIRTFLKQQLRKVGLEVNRFNAAGSFIARRQRMFVRVGVDLVLDAGASDGGFGSELRDAGYLGRIVSFEPLEKPFRSLSNKANKDDNWEALQYALGSAPEEAQMNIARDDKCSSFLAPLERQTRVYSGARTSSSTTVQVQRLRDLYGVQFQPGATPFLKIDTQGYEGRVIDGAGDVLDDLVGMQIELSLVPLFDGGQGYARLLQELEQQQFRPVLLEPVFIDPETEQTLQVDAVFFRKGLLL